MRTPPFIDPRRCTIALDADVLAGTGMLRKQLARRFQLLRSAGTFRSVVVDDGRDDSLRSSATTGKHDDLQKALLEVVHQTLTASDSGNSGAPFSLDQMIAGIAYFVTDDHRALMNRDAFFDDTPPLIVVTLEEFFEIYQEWVNWNS